MTALLITPEEATHLIATRLPRFPVTTVRLADAHGQILRETIVADRDLPPYDRVTMDGVAIRYESWQQGRTTFTITATATAGQPAPALEDVDKGCVQVMTGTMCPDGADTVIPYEDLDIDGARVTITPGAHVAPLHNLHSRGSDRRQGDTVLAEGTVLHGPHISIAAAVGRPTLTVAARPAVAIVSTGDELKSVGESVHPHQIRSANDQGIRASFLRDGYSAVDPYHVKDDLDATVSLLDDLFHRYGVVVLTGGVSMGKHDYVPKALEQLGVISRFHKIRQKPGKPMWFGCTPQQQPVFALPGNTVSTLVCLHRYVLPGLAGAMGALPPTRPCARLKEAFRFPVPLTAYIPIRLEWHADGYPLAVPVQTNTSGDFASLANSDGFIELDADTEHFPAGHTAPYWPWR